MCEHGEVPSPTLHFPDSANISPQVSQRQGWPRGMCLTCVPCVADNLAVVPNLPRRLRSEQRTQQSHGLRDWHRMHVPLQRSVHHEASVFEGQACHVLAGDVITELDDRVPASAQLWPRWILCTGVNGNTASEF